MSPLLSEVTEVLRDVFGDDEITLTESTTADDVEGWDSLMHLNLIIALERRFGIRFSTSEISTLKEEGQNIGNLLHLILAKKELHPERR
jgi:acyl carrier protein